MAQTGQINSHMPLADGAGHTFCELYIRHHIAGRTHGLSYNLSLTQPDLGDIAGLSGVHVNRSLQELRRRGLIDLRHRRVSIRNWQGLKTLAEFEVSYLHVDERAGLFAIDEPLHNTLSNSLDATQSLIFTCDRSANIHIQRPK